MKLIRFGTFNKEKPGVLVNDICYDVSSYIKDYDEAFFREDGLVYLSSIMNRKGSSLPMVDKGIRIGSPIARPSKIVCVGMNYADHAKEINIPTPPEPVIFMKATSAFSGPYDDILLPLNSVKTDWEVELAVVIGKEASYIKEADAMNYVAGYSILNDLSEREYQMERGGTWDKGKGCNTFAPMGPWMVTKNQLKDPHNLRLWLSLNGTIMQDSNTRNLIFNIPYLIAYISHFMTFLPGDVLCTGTPGGVGTGRNPKVFLKEGDMLTLGIDGLGASRQVVKNTYL